MLLRNKFLYPAKILPVTHNHNFSAHIDLQLLQLLKIFRRAVVRIDHIRLGISGRRHSVERHHHPWIVVVWIALDMLARRPMHFHSSGRRDVHADFLRIIHPDFVFDNLSLESGVSKFLRDIIGGRFVLGRARHMWRLR